MTRIALLRHLPTEWNAAGRLQGRTDVPLSAASRTELRMLSLPAAWAGVPILSSPLVRARETAEGLAGGPVPTDARLIEMDFGRWEGVEGAALLADPASPYRPVERWGRTFRPPGGESVAELQARLLPLLAEIAAVGRPRILVTHRGVMRAILALAADWAYRGPEPFRIKRAALHPVRLAADGRPVAFAPPVKLERAG
ncbi:MAG: histidine phosphatase family protein [Pseudomonadota bacterium]